jgi:hypothetical protein
MTKADLATAQEMRLERIEKTETTLLREFRKWQLALSRAFGPTKSWLAGSMND